MRAAPDVLREWRNSKDLTQAQAAKKVGVRAATWCDWEKGNKEPKTDHAQDLEKLTEGRVTMVMWAERSRLRTKKLKLKRARAS